MMVDIPTSWWVVVGAFHSVVKLSLSPSYRIGGLLTYTTPNIKASLLWSVPYPFCSINAWADRGSS